jgi:hypothetical protein
MLKTLARFQLLRFRGVAPGLRAPFPANDNVPAVPRPERRSRITRQELVCRWSLTGDGTRLACRWQPELPAPPASDGSGLEADARVHRRRRSNLAVGTTDRARLLTAGA